MRIVDHSTYPVDPKKVNLLDRVVYSIQYGLSWYPLVEAQARVIALASKLLDNKYTLLHNLTIPGLEAPIPLVLVGPPGVFVFNVTPTAGIFRARGESWASVDDQRRYKAIRPNLIMDTAAMAKTVQEYLIQRGVPELTVEPVLMCTNSGTHVESVRPVTRVVLSDAMERFVAGLPASGQVLISVELDEIVAFLENPAKGKPEAKPAEAARPPVEPKPHKPSFLEQLNLTHRQLVILAVLGGGCALALLGVILVILLSP